MAYATGTMFWQGDAVHIPNKDGKHDDGDQEHSQKMGSDRIKAKNTIMKFIVFKN